MSDPGIDSVCPKCECPKCCGGRQPQYVVCLFAFARLSEKAAKLAAAAEQAAAYKRAMATLWAYTKRDDAPSQPKDTLTRRRLHAWVIETHGPDINLPDHMDGVYGRDEDEIEKVWDLANQPTCMLEPKRAT